MRRIVVALVALLVVFAALPADAGARPDKDWKDIFGHMSAGIMMPQGDLDRVVEDELWLSGGVLYWPSDWNVGLQADLGWVDTNVKNEVIQAINDQLGPGEGSVTGGSVETWSLSANVLWSPNKDGKFGFYVIGGIGLDFIDARLTDDALVYYPPVCDPWFWWCYPGGVGPGTVAVLTRDSTEFGWNAGVGLTVEMKGGSELFLEARYKSFDFASQTNEILPITLGVRW